MPNLETKHFDYIIVGQGLAGSLLAWMLKREGKGVLVIDEAHKSAASTVAAGLINPVTGRRYVKSWRVDELIPYATKTYKTLEWELGIPLFYSRNILRTLFNAREANDWLLRTDETAYAAYMLEEAKLENYARYAHPAYAHGEVTQCAQVRIGSLVTTLAKRWLKEGSLLQEAFEHEKLEVKEDGIRYQNYSADRLIFCEGARAIGNPYFNYLPFGGSKGEVLIIRLPEASFEKVLKRRVFIVPLGDGTYWIGSAYHWQFEHEGPTSEGGAYLKARLEDILQTPFEVVAHLAAVRPTVKDRRPFLGQHPQFSCLYLFNGLGTKGTSLGPFFAGQMVDFLLRDNPLDPEVDIRRFE